MSIEIGSNTDLTWFVICRSACCTSLNMCRPFPIIDISLLFPRQSENICLSTAHNFLIVLSIQDRPYCHDSYRDDVWIHEMIFYRWKYITPTYTGGTCSKTRDKLTYTTPWAKAAWYDGRDMKSNEWILPIGLFIREITGAIELFIITIGLDFDFKF